MEIKTLPLPSQLLRLGWTKAGLAHSCEVKEGYTSPFPVRSRRATGRDRLKMVSCREISPVSPSHSPPHLCAAMHSQHGGAGESHKESPPTLSFRLCPGSCPHHMSLSLLGLCPPDSSDSELELSTVRHQPEGLDQLQALTKFTKKELQSLYRGFKNVSAPVSPVPVRASREILAHLPVSYPGNGVFAGLLCNGRAIWGVGLSMDIVKATVPLTSWDSFGMKGAASATPSTLPSACPTKGFPSPGLRGAHCASGSGHLILPEGGERSALWSQAWSQKWPRPLRGVTSPCRSVPRAWWMKTPSNSSTHSSSRREVSPNPGPPRLLPSPDHVPFLGRGVWGPFPPA